MSICETLEMVIYLAFLHIICLWLHFNLTLLIIDAAFLWVCQNIVGLCNLFEFVLGVCVWVLVWVVTERQTLVRPSDLLLIRVT